MSKNVVIIDSKINHLFWRREEFHDSRLIGIKYKENWLYRKMSECKHGYKIIRLFEEKSLFQNFLLRSL